MDARVRPRGARVSEALLPAAALELPFRKARALDARGGYWAAASEQGELAVGTVEPFALSRVEKVRLGGVASLCVLPARDLVVLVGDDPRGALRGLVATGDRGRFEEGAHTRWVHAVCALPEERGVATVSLDGTLRVWELTSEGPRRTHKLEAGIRPRVVCAHPKGRHLLTSGDDRILRAFNLARGEQVHAFARVDPATGAHDAGSWAHSSRYLCPEEDGATLLWEDLDGGLARWDFRTGARLAQHPARFLNAACSLAGGLAAGGDATGELQVFVRSRGPAVARASLGSAVLGLARTAPAELLALTAEGALTRWELARFAKASPPP